MTKSELLQIAKPILFNTDMVRAILDRRRTVTRKVIKPANPFRNKEGYHQGNGLWIDGYSKNDEPNGHIKDYSVSSCWMTRKYYLEKYAPYQPGDTLYVRETWNTNPLHDYGNESNKYVYKADYDGHAGEFGWSPPIRMPKEAARIFLRVIDVRVERLQDITEEQAIKEGFKGVRCRCGGTAYACTDCYNTGWVEPPYVGFMYTWDSTIKKKDLVLYGWKANPWVWVIEFERIVPDGF